MDTFLGPEKYYLAPQKSSMRKHILAPLELITFGRSDRERRQGVKFSEFNQKYDTPLRNSTSGECSLGLPEITDGGLQQFSVMNPADWGPRTVRNIPHYTNYNFVYNISSW
jgi:hypothetical protein